MKPKITNRQFLSAAIIIFYLIPLLFFSSYSIGLMPHQKSWAILSLGLLTVACGTLTLLLLVYYWEESIQTKMKDKQQLLSLPRIYESEYDKVDKVAQINSQLDFIESNVEATSDENMRSTERRTEENLREGSDETDLLQSIVATKNDEIQKLSLEIRELQAQVDQTTQDYADYRLFSDEQLKQKQMQLTSFQQVVEDQRSEMEKRQEQIHQLDTKIHDLSYEIKTLLYLNDEEKHVLFPGPSRESLLDQTEQSPEPIQSLFDLQEDDSCSEMPIKTPTEATQLLKKCINIAQKLTGVNYFGNEISRYRELPTSYYTIDQRRLFDSLRVETRALILVYSQKDLKVLFANNQSKSLLGWPSDKITSDFSTIFQSGMADWKKMISLLSSTVESQGHLLAKTKYGEELLLNCHLGVIPTGLFRHYVIAVLYPA